MKTIKELPPLDVINRELDFNFETGEVSRRYVVPDNDAITINRGFYKFGVTFNGKRYGTMRSSYESIIKFRDEVYETLSKERMPVVVKPNEKGYVKITINGESYPLHRVIYYAYHKVDMGQLQVDHIDMDKANNAISNLRLSDGVGQNGNRVTQKNSTSGFRGVTHHKNVQGDKTFNYWLAALRQNRKVIFQKLYPFTDEGFKQACIDVEQKRKEHFGEFYNAIN